MALTPGTRLGPYVIDAPIGAGGMGEVYRARDTSLNRDVAIKVLPASVAADPERLARFDREAKSLAALNHPNIAAIYGLVEGAIVMELVPGRTLAEVIAWFEEPPLHTGRADASGPGIRGAGLSDPAIAVNNALRIAQQIAEALEAAHDKGIVHRDLKPANVKVRDDGTVKVLDFGLATAVQDPRGPSDTANSPTLTMGATQAGVILGTAAYMSPEQAAGRPVDKRADIWSFGVVLWEMLAGRPLFGGGETVSHTLADVLRAEITFSKLPASTPPPIRELLIRCLDRDVKTRLRDIGEARVTIRRWLANPATHPPIPLTPASEIRTRRGWPAWIVAGVAVLAAAALAFIHFRETLPPTPATVRFQIPLPEKAAFNGGLALSPDGRRVAFRVSSGGTFRVWVHDLDSTESRPMAGTEDTTGLSLFWSHDGRSIVFGVPGKLKSIDASGGAPSTLCDIPGNLLGGFSTRDGRIVFGTIRSGLFQVPETGGTPVPVTDLAQGEAAHGGPSPLPDGIHFVYVRQTTPTTSRGIFVGSLAVKPAGQDQTPLLTGEYSASYVPPASPSAGTGFLVFRREDKLMAQPFDPIHAQPSGNPVLIAEGLASRPGQWSVSTDGALILARTPPQENRLVWYDRNGRPEDAGLPSRPYFEIELSPDGTQVAVQDGGNAPPGGQPSDIWVYDMTRRTPVPLTRDAALDLHPVWSPYDRRIAFYSPRGGVSQVFVKPADGASDEQPLLKLAGDVTGGGAGSGSAYPQDWSSDGRFLLLEVGSPGTGRDLWFFPLESGKPGTPAVYIKSDLNESQGQFSPNGRFVAYRQGPSGPSGSGGIYVSTFPDPTIHRWTIAANGFQPRWQRDSKALLYFTADGNLMSVDVSLTGPFGFTPGSPKLVLPHVPIFDGGATANQIRWDISPDGQRFLINTLESAASDVFTVVLNWPASLKK